MEDFMYLKDDLISRSNLLMHLNDYALQEAPFLNGGSKVAYEAVRNCMKAIEEQPPVEAVPVVRGEWIKTFKSMVQNLNTGKAEPKYSCDCSICKWHTGNQGTRFNFCPHCGADMRKKV